MAKKELSYSNAMKELQTIMSEIEQHDANIDILIEKVKRASELIKYCKKQLTETNSEIQKVLDSITE